MTSSVAPIRKNINDSYSPVEKQQYHWFDDLNDYIRTMTLEQGYEGELYWAEEETWIRNHFGPQYFNRTLSVGCGLFREAETLRFITKDLLVGLDYDSKFIQCIKPLETLDTKPVLRIIQGDAQEYSSSIKFDFIVSLFNGLSFIVDMPKALGKMFDNLTEDGRILLSFWKDNKEITAQRIKIYTAAGKNVSVVFNKQYGLQEIQVREGKKLVISNLIFTEKFLTDLVHSTLPHVFLRCYEGHYCRFILLKAGVRKRFIDNTDSSSRALTPI